MMPSCLLVKALWVELDCGSFGVDISTPEHVLMFIGVKNAHCLASLTQRHYFADSTTIFSASMSSTIEL